MKLPVFDFHCDTALNLAGGPGHPASTLRRNDGHIDLERAATLDGYCQCFACFTTTWENLPAGESVEEIFRRTLDAAILQMEKNSDYIRHAYSAAEVRENYAAGKMSGILTIEGPAGFGFDPAMLEQLYAIGFRASTLGWNEKNPLTGSNVTGGGLTDLGREYVRQCQRLGIAVDVSHISDEGFWDIMRITEKPIIASHSNSRAVHPCARNLTDDMFRAICETGGTAGFNMFAFFIGENVTLDTCCDHILHFLELDPDGRHISLGGDLDGCDVLPADFAGVQDYPKFAAALRARGVDDALLHRIFWDNALEVLDKCTI